MRILLTAINAKYIHSNLAVYSLEAYAQEYKKHIELAEFTINQTKDEILKGIFRCKPEVLCISCYIWNISLVKDIIREIHKILPDTAIWLGGPEVSYDAPGTLEECPEVTGIMKGEGEETFLELVRYYVEKKTNLSEMAGITYRTCTEGDIRIVENPWRDTLDLSTVPFVYADLEKFENRIIYYESSRGCPFSCSYCLSSIDKKLRFRNIELVKKELQFFLDHKVSQVKFVDRTFNCDHEHAMAIWSYLIEHDNQITNFHFEIAADILNEEEIGMIAGMRPGMIQLEIGVQSTNQDTIREIHRRMVFERVSGIVRQIQEGHNVHQHLDLIAGLPFEDYNSFSNSFNDVYKLRPQQLQLGFLKVLKGSFMHEMAEEYGCHYQDKEPYEVLFTRWISYQDVLRLKQVEEMVEVYYNSNQFLKTLPAMEKLFETPFRLYEALGEFYEKKGYMEISHTRLRRYEILLEFLMDKDPEHMDMYQELMIYDLYSRENMKSRPAWAGDLTQYKRMFREFYQTEMREHHFLEGYEMYDERQLGKMTHLEIMHYHPDTLEKGEYAFLFDYQKRDVLTYGALAQEVEV
ncbi:MAG: DUF4080 domain-containing protein [Clostridia bacterium]|nr:DUF4080 domain-containing protein [Clostridia bacterium]